MTDSPYLLDLYCGAGGAAYGYQQAGFHVTGVDLHPQKHYCGEEFIQGDALEYLAAHGHEYDAVHASPPCQAYTMMRNLPWLKGREYPALILPTRLMLDGLGKPYVLENVMGAKKGGKNLVKFGLEEHGLEAAWLCGAMFGLPLYRHRLFAANWLWMAPLHPKHRRGVKLPGNYIGHDVSVGQRETFTGSDGRERERKSPVSAHEAHPNPVNTDWRKYHDGHGLNIRPGYETKAFNYPTLAPGYLTDGYAERTRPDGSRGENKIGGPSIMLHDGNKGLSNGTWYGGKNAGWRLAAEAMGIDWMNREELTQAIPPVYTKHIGAQLLVYLGA